MHDKERNLLQKYIDEKKSIWITDSKYGKRKVIPQEIIYENMSNEKLSCYVLLVTKLGDTGNRMDTISFESIQDIHE